MPQMFHLAPGVLINLFISLFDASLAAPAQFREFLFGIYSKQHFDVCPNTLPCWSHS